MDYSLCQRSDCPKCETCWRYLMGKKTQDKWQSWLLPDVVPCECYVEEK